MPDEVDIFFKPHIERWQGRGDAVYVFTNHDLGHPDMGRQVAMPANLPAHAARLVIGKAHAPDGVQGLGWRYILTHVIEPGDLVPYKEN